MLSSKHKKNRIELKRFSSIKHKESKKFNFEEEIWVTIKKQNYLLNEIFLKPEQVKSILVGDSNVLIFIWLTS